MRVNEGDVLAQLNDTEAKAQLTATRAQLVQAERDYTRQQGLADR